MNNQNLGFYRFLEAAFRYRVYNSKGQTATLNTQFSLHGYTLTYRQIFYYARRMLPKSYTGDAINYPDTEEGNVKLAKAVLEKLDRNLDQELAQYFNPDKAPAEHKQIIAEAQIASQQNEIAPVAATTPAGLPLAPAISRPPAYWPTVPKAPPEEIRKQKATTPGEKQTVAESETNLGQLNPPILVKQGALTQTPLPAETSSHQTASGAELKDYGPEDEYFHWEPNTLNPTASMQPAGVTESSPVSNQEAKSEPPSAEAAQLGSLGATNPGVMFQTGSSFSRSLSSRSKVSLKVNLNRMGDAIGNGLSAAAPSFKRMFNDGLDGLNRLSDPRRRSFLKKPRSASKFLSTGRKVAIVMLLLFIVFMATLLGSLGNGTTSTGQAAPISNPANPNNPNPSNSLNGCKFTRNRLATPIASSRLASLFTEVAAKTGVPAATLASLAMHESAVFTSAAKDNHDAFGSNITTTAGCIHFATSPTGALGLMQVQPPKAIQDILTAAGKAPPFESVGAYSADGVERGAKFVNKTANTLTLQDFCDVRTSIYLGAGVLISKNGGKPPTTANEINSSVCGYYGKCTYTEEGETYDYGAEAQNDFENCKPNAGTAPAPPGPIGVSLTCPIGGNTSLICGTAANPAPNGCGHGIEPKYTTRCNPYYYVCDTSSPKGSDGGYEKYSPALYYAIDVAGTNEVKMPYVNGNKSVTWTREKTPTHPDGLIPIGGNAEWGYRLNFTAKTADGKDLYLDLTHLSKAGLSSKDSLESGEVLGKYIGGDINHLHIGLSVNGNLVDPLKQANMCVQ